MVNTQDTKYILIVTTISYVKIYNQNSLTLCSIPNLILVSLMMMTLVVVTVSVTVLMAGVPSAAQGKDTDTS